MLEYNIKSNNRKYNSPTQLARNFPAGPASCSLAKPCALQVTGRKPDMEVIFTKPYYARKDSNTPLKPFPFKYDVTVEYTGPRTAEHPKGMPIKFVVSNERPNEEFMAQKITEAQAKRQVAESHKRSEEFRTPKPKAPENPVYVSKKERAPKAEVTTEVAAEETNITPESQPAYQRKTIPAGISPAGEAIKKLAHPDYGAPLEFTEIPAEAYSASISPEASLAEESLPPKSPYGEEFTNE